MITMKSICMKVRNNPVYRNALVFLASAALAGGCTALKAPAPDTLIAHRGHVSLSKTHPTPPENTLASFRDAVDSGFGFECDIIYTKDKRVFTTHDGCFRRCFGIDNENYKGMTWDYVSKLVPIDSSGVRHPDTRVALFEEVCALARDGRWIFVELKTDPEIVPLVRDILRRQTNANPQNLAFITFHPDTLKAVKQALPEYKAMLLLYSRKAWPHKKVKSEAERAPYTAEECLEKLRACGADGLDFHYDRTLAEQGPAFVKAIREAGYEFHYWTIDRPEDARKAFANGALSVTTNHPRDILLDR